MTLAELTALYRFLHGDIVADYLWSDAAICAWINEAESEACERAELIFEDGATADLTTYAVAAGLSASITLHTAIIGIERAEIIDTADNRCRLWPTDRIELERIKPDWRTTTEKPERYIHDDKSLRLACITDQDYTLRLEVYRGPTAVLSVATPTGVPQIRAQHHKHLLDWVQFRAYSVPDKEVFDERKAALGLASFEAYFGPRPDAQQRRDQRANLPHRNKGVW